VIFQAWANQVLRNKIGNYLQKTKTEERVLSRASSDQLSNQQSESDPQLKLILEKCLNLVRKSHRMYYDIIIMANDGYNTDEICKEHNIKSGHLYVMLARSRAKLKACLERGAKNE